MHRLTACASIVLSLFLCSVAVPAVGQIDDGIEKTIQKPSQVQTTSARHSRNERETRGPKSGHLILHGGGMGKGTFDCIAVMARLARKGLDDDEPINVVIIPTAKPGYKDTLLERTKILLKFHLTFPPEANARVTCLHTRKKKEADSKSFCRPLRNAHLVILLGGYQRRLAESYSGTRFYDELWGVLGRGGVIAGASAGAIIQSTIFSRTPEGKSGFSFITNSVVDVHATERKRQNHLVEMLSKKQFDNSNYLGIAIDEAVAVIVSQDVLEVLGERNVMIVNRREWVDGKKPFFQTLSGGDLYDLRNRKLLPKRRERKELR